MKRLVLAANTCAQPFAKKVLETLKEKEYPDLALLDMTERKFDNSEIKVRINESIRGADFFLIQDAETRECNYTTSDAVTAMKSALGAAQQADVGRIVLISLSFPFARQDKTEGREWLGAAKFCHELEDVFHVKNIFYMDIHNPAIAGFFRKARAENLRAIPQQVEYIKKNWNITKCVFADTGGFARAEGLAYYLDSDLDGFQKKRDPISGKILAHKLLGPVKDEVCLVVEDMIGTGGTIVDTCKKLKEAGAKEIYVTATHGLFNNPATKRMSELYEEGCLKAVLCTDTIYHSDEWKRQNPWYQEISVASLVAKAIHNLHTDQSISQLLTDLP